MSRTPDQNRPSPSHAPPRRGLRALLGADRGNVAMIFAICLPLLILLVGGAVDVWFISSTHTHLQDSTDAAGLAVSAAVAANPNATPAALQATAQNSLNSNIGPTSGAHNGTTTTGATITDFHVCALPIQTDCTDKGVAMADHTIAISTSAVSPCFLFTFVKTVCNNGSSGRTVTASAVTSIGYAQTLQINMMLDTSASMIVGATQNDVNLIAKWVGNNWSSVKPLGGDSPPCAFACHDVGGATARSDIMKGLTNAHSAGATTRFDVVISASQALMDHINQETSSSTLLSVNSYVFNVYGFDSPSSTNLTPVTQYYPTATAAQNITWSQAKTALGKVNPGLDTHMVDAMTQIIGILGSNGTGSSTTSPLKFLIIATDGLQSDRDANWCGSQVADKGPWLSYDLANPPSPTYSGWSNICQTSPYATSISASQCTQIKNAGIVLAILETPYVPLNGQSPSVRPYEKTVRQVIYPNGPNTTSTVSTALQACASTGYYFQASSSSDIATGFTTLTDKFIYATPTVRK